MKEIYCWIGDSKDLQKHLRLQMDKLPLGRVRTNHQLSNTQDCASICYRRVELFRLDSDPFSVGSLPPPAPRSEEK
jgi:hypothetical protein